MADLLMDGYERGAKAVEIASDVVKQLLGLSTAILALTITFSTDIVPNRSETPTSWLFLGWGVYLASIVFGLWGLMALAGELERSGSRSPSIYQWNVRVPVGLQILAFLVATVMIIVYAINAVG